MLEKDTQKVWGGLVVPLLYQVHSPYFPDPIPTLLPGPPGVNSEPKFLQRVLGQPAFELLGLCGSGTGPCYPSPAFLLSSFTSLPIFKKERKAFLMFLLQK